MWFGRSLRFAAVSARMCVWTVDLHILMPGPENALQRLSVPLPLTVLGRTHRESHLGFVDAVEIQGREILTYGRLTRGPRQDWFATEMYLGREFVVPRLRYLEVEETPTGRRRVWDWAVTGFELTRSPAWDDLPAPRVEHSRSSW